MAVGRVELEATEGERATAVLAGDALEPALDPIDAHPLEASPVRALELGVVGDVEGTERCQLGDEGHRVGLRRREPPWLSDRDPHHHQRWGGRQRGAIRAGEQLPALVHSDTWQSPCSQFRSRGPRAGRSARPVERPETLVAWGLSLNAPGWIRTSDLRIRSPLLYPAELPGRAPPLRGRRHRDGRIRT